MRIIQGILQAIKRFFADYIEDILIISGLTFVVIATFLWSKIAGFYCLGACLFGLGAYFALYEAKRK